MAVEKLDRPTLVGLFAMSVGVLVVAIDFTALSVAIPAIERSFNTDVTTAQWVINTYAMVFGVVIVTGGRLADMFGRRRIFVVGASIFATSSLIAGLSPEVWVLLACRAGMGVGGALMWPSIIGMIFSILPKERQGLGGGLLTSVAGLGNAAGPLLGGFLTDAISWRWIFFINVPVAAIGIITALLVIPKDQQDDVKEGIDYGGMASLTLGLLSVLLALDWGVDRGWTDPVVLGLFGLGAVFLVGFGFYEDRKGEVALVPETVMKNLGFAMVVLTTLMIAAIFFGALLYLPQFMTKTLGFSAAEAGAGLLPMMATYALLSIVAGRIYEIIGPKLMVSLGVALLAAGMFILARLDTNTTYLELIPGMVVLAFGIAIFYSSITTAGVTALDPSKASLAGAIVYMANVAGGAVGLGLNTAIVASASSQTVGISTAFIVDASLALVGLVLALIFIGGPVDKERLRNLRHHYRAHN
ncbi:MAG: MFS transporter [Pseudomonadota bacterium]